MAVKNTGAQFPDFSMNAGIYTTTAFLISQHSLTHFIRRYITSAVEQRH